MVKFLFPQKFGEGTFARRTPSTNLVATISYQTVEKTVVAAAKSHVTMQKDGHERGEWPWPSEVSG